MEINIDIVDAFTSKQFGGNSAAVIITNAWLPEKLMQSIAAQNNLSETAFLMSNSMHGYHIRWFSPITEIDFCGHATLAAAFVIFTRQPSLTEIELLAPAVGKMKVTNLSNGLIEMDFPNLKPQKVSELPSLLISALSIKPKEVLKNQQAYFAIYDDEQDVINIKQDSALLKQLSPFDVVVTAPSEQYDFVSRYFWPANGTDEDSVTGSIHTGLAPYWSEVFGKTKLRAYQASKRGGELFCELQGERVKLSGRAVRYLTGKIMVKLTTN